MAVALGDCSAGMDPTLAVDSLDVLFRYNLPRLKFWY